MTIKSLVLTLLDPSCTTVSADLNKIVLHLNTVAVITIRLIRSLSVQGCIGFTSVGQVNTFSLVKFSSAHI